MRILKLDKEISLIISILGAAQAIFLSVSTFFRRKNGAKNYLLFIVFFSVSIRIIKSLLWVYLSDLNNWFINFGFVAHAIFGPALFLYVLFALYNAKWKNKYFLHFIIPLILIFLSPLATLKSFWYQGGYTLLLVHQMIYTLVTVFLLLRAFRDKGNYRLNKDQKYWLLILVTGAFFLQLAYFSNFILGLTPYLLGPIVYAVFIYIVSFYLFRNPQVVFSNTYYRKEKVSLSRSKEIKEMLVVYLEKSEDQFDSDCSLKKVASSIKVHPYELSYVINQEFSKSFSELINELRIKKAKRMLSAIENSNITISAIAYDCGYNSLSTFNSTFKKLTKTTPSQFKEKMMNS